MTTSDDVTTAVRRYLAEVASGTGSSIAALYAAEATVEDPVGSDPHRGVEAIAAFYAAIEQTERSTELLTIRVAGASVAFHFRVTTTVGDRTVVVEPIDVMTFDAELKITSMRAFWSQADMVVG
ncbi:nuclear transport factor 2 family protein [Rhodococcus sp. NPDC058505]|uniref:nuclear transport factor 2 family protein n=1 Tax=unclassified Rhodococcus (in: high G+C Gram-positive bacteria) TaxID=192944 RepID=UPI00364EAD44